MTFLEHLIELRARLVKSLIVVSVTSVVGLVFAKKIFGWLQIPMNKALPEGSFFIATQPFESYFTYFKVALLSGLFASSPFLFYHFWRFVSPGLKDAEKKQALPFAIASAILFVGGGLFGYFVVFPAGFYYVNQILAGTSIRLLPAMSQYLNFATTLLLAFGVSFELPLAIFLLGRLGLITTEHIRKNRRYVIVILFVAAAALTPGPDVLSQCLLAIPLWILYELGGLSLRLIRR